MNDAPPATPATEHAKHLEHLAVQERAFGLPPGTLLNVFIQLLPTLLQLFGSLKPPTTPPVTPPVTPPAPPHKA